MENKIQLMHPQGKKAVRMDKGKYELLKAEILNYLNENSEGSFSEIVQSVAENFKNKNLRFGGSLKWYLEWVKLDLEARKIITKSTKKPLQMYHLTNSSI